MDFETAPRIGQGWVAGLADEIERLWRKDKSRTGGEHFGLGLALAQAFAKSIGWTIEASLSEDSFLTMTLRETDR